jgi:hypothetical protein
MNLKPGGDLASIDGSHDGVRTRASPKLIITPKRIELALRLAAHAQLSVKLSACARLATHDASHNFVCHYYRVFISTHHF